MNGIAVRGQGYLNFDNARTLLEDDEAGTRGVLDRLCDARVLRRGLLLKCERCEWLAFYLLQYVGATFDCIRCEYRNRLSQPRWHLPVSEPVWFYDLDKSCGSCYIRTAMSRFLHSST